MNKLNGESLNIVNENIEKLKELFPEVFSEGKINFTKLEEELGEFTEKENERYNFTWNGKQEAKKIAQTPSTGTLRPCEEESKDWDTTKNLYIEGDNLEVLKLLQKSYHKKVKMIYIDPPYNTGNDFVYKDNFKDNIKNYLEQTGQVDSEGNRLSTNSDTSGRYHSDWLSMMYPRLKLARNLLKDDGVIFISIDENEFDNLKKICDEVFGEDNFRNSILTRRRVKSLNVQFADDGLNSLNVGYEYILVYSKTNQFTFKAIRMKKEKAPIKGTWNVFWSNADRPTMRYELLNFTPETGQWRWSKEKALDGIKNYDEYINNYSNDISLEEYWKKTGEKLRFVRRIEDGYGKNGGVQYWVGPSDTSLRTSNWTDIEVSQIKKDFDIPFDNPKNIKLINTVISTIEEDDFLILDFFSGSSTTAHATMNLNSDDKGNRKFIMVQLPEKTNNEDYSTICELGKERIRQAGEKIKKDNQDKNLSNLDIGFKVLKLDSSNIKEWDSDFDNLEENLLDGVENIKSDRTSKDLLYEILLKYGLDLTLPIEEKTIDGKKIFVIGFGALVACLDDDITTDIVESIAKLKEEYETEIMRVVFKDSSFKNAVVKTNAIQILKQFDIDEVVSI
ncbi:site-specific DNA-methyltransferase [Patescibacteria group bacterium]|nr:site-specific DNA-methyltransferase [Patescibacteria group bacterium]